MTDQSYREAQFCYPLGLAFDELAQSLLVCDSMNHRIRRVSLQGICATCVCYACAKRNRNSKGKWRVYIINLLLGQVMTVCEVQNPTFVAVTANCILVSSAYSNKIFAIVNQLYMPMCILILIPYFCCLALIIGI